MKVAELNGYVDDLVIRGRLSRSLADTLAATPAEATRVGFIHLDPALVLLPLMRISPSVKVRRRLHVAFNFGLPSLDGDIETIMHKLTQWRADHENTDTLRQSYAASKEMFRIMYARSAERGEQPNPAPPATRTDLVVSIFTSGSPILASFGDTFANDACERFLSGSSLARA